MNNIKLIVGLGNPDNEYSNTRHNVGFWALDILAQKHSVSFKESAKFFGEFANINTTVNNKILSLFLLKPLTYMNLSGKAVYAIANFYKIMPEEILVIHDELDFEVGTIKLKQDGGNGGHNGLKDIDRVIGKKYWRLRVGIGHPGDKNKVVSYVLKSPNIEDKIEIINSIDRAINVFDLIISGEINAAMQKLHSK